MTHLSASEARPNRMRRTVAGFGLTAVLLAGGGIAVASPALAQDDRPTVEDRQARAEERIERLLENDRIDEERAQKLRDRLAAHAEQHATREAAKAELADLLGMSVEELRAALRDGSSLADLADSAGVDRQVLIDRFVAEAEAKIDEAVAADKLTESEADEKRASIVARVEAKIDGEQGDRGDRSDKRGRGHHRRGSSKRGPRAGR